MDRGNSNFHIMEPFRPGSIQNFLIFYAQNPLFKGLAIIFARWKTVFALSFQT
jgi:hypothetical protein